MIVPASATLAKTIAALTAELERVAPGTAALYPSDLAEINPTGLVSDLIGELDSRAPHGHRFGKTEGGALEYFAAPHD